MNGVFLSPQEFAAAKVLYHLEIIMTALSNILSRPGRTLTTFTGSIIAAANELEKKHSTLGLIPGSTAHDQIYQVLRATGYNSTSYLALESDKQHFLHPATAAVTAYAVFNRIAISAGEPICSPAELPFAIDEFITFSHQQQLRPLFFEVTEPTVP
ncbi:MAG: phosphatidylglycerol lysyltransferase domain-containing protein, partial [Kovacikia sp.]